MTGETVQGNYTVTYEQGEMTIVSVDTVLVRIIGNSGTYLYDGTEKDASGYTVEISNPLYTVSDFIFEGNDELKEVNAGAYAMSLAADQFRNVNADFENVIFDVADGHTVAEAEVLHLEAGEAYSVLVPAIEGYLPVVTEVAGRMGEHNQQITVFMVSEAMNQANEGNGDTSTSPMTYIHLDEYGTPWGIPNNVRNSGEIIE